MSNVNIQDIREGKLDGNILYICDLRYNSADNKPIRHIKPTKVIVVSNKETNKRIFYSESHFKKIGKNDKPIGSPISLFDNTGYRSYAGEPVEVFNTLEECESRYNELVDIAVEKLTKFRDSQYELLSKRIDALTNSKLGE